MTAGMDCLRDKFVQGQLLDGRFLTVTPLNHGSFGMVFLAKDTLTGEDVAIKCLTKPSSAPSSDLAVDERSEELDCHNRLKHHPNLVNLVHSFETSSHLFLVLEYCSMGDLYEAIRLDRGPLQTEHVRDFMLQLVGAVEFMHSKGLYHRDIKPENIFLCQDGSMKLGDFGLATRSPWSFEACVGSDRYMAPEQYEPTAAGYSPTQADIWSVGICLLNILFAKNPFVTPTESDVLFADYTRDRQSLFDIFPNMSQDTYEVLTHSLALEPNKRSLSGMRDALLRAVSFTTDDESLDDFCTEDRDLVPASANREPLRTPSIQSPHINQGDSFPWAKALQSTPQQAVRQLSAIPDTEVDSEDLFSTSAEQGSWYSTHAGSPSMSTLASTFGMSMKSQAAFQPTYRFPPPPKLAAGSLPNRVGVPIPSMASVFGKDKNEQVSKSWSDLWDEDQMENEMSELHERQAHNARTWSQESKDADVDTRPSGLSELGPVSSSLNRRSNAPSHNAVAIPTPGKLKAARETQSPARNPSPSKYSPPKRSMDKWSALGQKRRNYHPREQQPEPKSLQFTKKNWRKEGSGEVLGLADLWGKKASTSRNHQSRNQSPAQPHFLTKDWRHDPFQTIKAKKNTCPFATHHVDSDEEFDFVGGWQDLHV